MDAPEISEERLELQQQETLRRMARRRKRKGKTGANSGEEIRSWAEYSGFSHRPAGAHSRYARWLLLIAAIGLVPVLFFGWAQYFGPPDFRDATIVDDMLGNGMMGLVILAGITAGAIVVYSFVRAILEANRR